MSSSWLGFLSSSLFSFSFWQLIFYFFERMVILDESDSCDEGSFSTLVGSFSSKEKWKMIDLLHKRKKREIRGSQVQIGGGMKEFEEDEIDGVVEEIKRIREYLRSVGIGS